MTEYKEKFMKLITRSSTVDSIIEVNKGEVVKNYPFTLDIDISKISKLVKYKAGNSFILKVLDKDKSGYYGRRYCNKFEYKYYTTKDFYLFYEIESVKGLRVQEVPRTIKSLGSNDLKYFDKDIDKGLELTLNSKLKDFFTGYPYHLSDSDIKKDYELCEDIYFKLLYLRFRNQGYEVSLNGATSIIFEFKQMTIVIMSDGTENRCLWITKNIE